MNDFGLLIGRFFTTLPSLNDEQLSELMLDASGRLIISGRYLEDSAHVSGDAGLFTMGVRDDGVNASIVYETVTFTADVPGAAGNVTLVFNAVDTLTTIVGAFNSANPTNTVSFSGQAGAYVAAAGSAILVGGADNTTFTSANGDYSPIAVDKFGRLQVTADFVMSADFVYAEDSAHISASQGAYVLAVRQDTLASSVSADGDYASFKVNSLGELYVHDIDSLAELVTANATLTTIDTSLNAIEASVDSIDTKLDATNALLTTIDADTASIAIDATSIAADTAVIAGDTTSIDTTLTDLSKAEDSVHTSGDKGIMALAVRNDTNATLTSADGDYSPIATDSAGRIKVLTTESLEGAEQYIVTDALAAAGDGIVTITAAATPWITVASFLHTSGVAFVYGWQLACDQNADARLVTDDTTDVIVYKRALNSSAQPTYQEHWSKDGRIEIAGSASLEIKLQIKKRSATGGNANGTGSIHIRK